MQSSFGTSLIKDISRLQQQKAIGKIKGKAKTQEGHILQRKKGQCFWQPSMDPFEKKSVFLTIYDL